MIRLHQMQRIFPVGEQRVHALQDINLTISRGDYLAIMGPSGSGKSTLLNILGLLDRPTAGRYELDGEELSSKDDEALARIRRDKIGFVFQAFHLIARLTAAENVELPMILAGITPRERRRRVDHTLQALGLGERASHRPDQLSGGQRQRVAIARAIALQPQVLLADEPTGNLDQAAGREVLAILEQLNNNGLTLLVVTHDPEIGQRAPRCLRMVDGRIVADLQQVPLDASV